MPEQPPSPRSNDFGGPSAPQRTPNPPDAVAPRWRIEDYLDQLCAPLVGRVPYAQRQEMRAEWRAHLEALAEAYEELGSAPEQAVAEALRQFGEPRRLQRAWAEARSSLSPPDRLPPAARRWFALTSSASLTLIVTGLLGGLPEGSPPSDGVALLALLTMPVSAAFLACWLARVPSPRRLLYALTVLFSTAAGIGVLADLWSRTGGELLRIQCTFWMLGGIVGTLEGFVRDQWARWRAPRVVE